MIWTPYLKGDNDVAIASAFKRVEVEMREKGSFARSDFDERLIKKFFEVSEALVVGSTDQERRGTLREQRASCTSSTLRFVEAGGALGTGIEERR